MHFFYGIVFIIYEIKWYVAVSDYVDPNMIHKTLQIITMLNIGDPKTVLFKLSTPRVMKQNMGFTY